MPLLKVAVIIGANGQFGHIFAQKLSEEGLRLTGIDVQPSATWPVDRYCQTGPAGLTDDVCAEISQADLVLFCTPADIVAKAIPRIAGIMRPDAIAVDIASTKSEIFAAVRATEFPAGYLSIHPMFAPNADFRSRNFCVVRMADGVRVGAVLELLSRWGAEVTEVAPADHDRTAAYVQAGVHAAVLAYAATLARGGISLDTVRSMSTPVQQLVLSLAARISSGDPGLYASIQTDNPFAKLVREQLASHLAAFASPTGLSADGMGKLFREISIYLGVDRGNFVEMAAKAISGSRRG